MYIIAMRVIKKGAYREIIERSKAVDAQFSSSDADDLLRCTVNFPVPKGRNHPRRAQIESYNLQIIPRVTRDYIRQNQLIVLDSGVSGHECIDKTDTRHVLELQPGENSCKEVHALERTLQERKVRELDIQEVVGIGGGIITNVATYIAEQMQTRLTLIPTTVLGMADASSGGKVRMNRIVGKQYKKHAVKRFYEPDKILLPHELLNTMGTRRVIEGAAEILKHGMYQSRTLLESLLSVSGRDLTRDKTHLLRSIVWTAALKAVCLEVDPAESRAGSGRILRGAHDLSDQLEEKSAFTMPHGMAVWMSLTGEEKQLFHNDQELLGRIKQWRHELITPSLSTPPLLVDSVERQYYAQCAREANIEYVEM